MSDRRHSRPVTKRAMGSGKSGRCASLNARCRVTPAMCPISFRPTRSSIRRGGIGGQSIGRARAIDGEVRLTVDASQWVIRWRPATGLAAAAHVDSWATVANRTGGAAQDRRGRAIRAAAPLPRPHVGARPRLNDPAAPHVEHGEQVRQQSPPDNRVVPIPSLYEPRYGKAR